MRSFQRKLAILSYDTAHLLILISELNELREAAEESGTIRPESAAVEAAEKNAN